VEVNEKLAKRLRRAVREYAQIDSIPPAWEYQRDARGTVRLLPQHPRAVYRKLKRIENARAGLA
jgi:hypothetical protein